MHCHWKLNLCGRPAAANPIIWWYYAMISITERNSRSFQRMIEKALAYT